MHKFTIHGARGSFPASGKEYLKFGGHTTCFSLETEKELIIFDAGTGIIPFGNALTRQSEIPEVNLFFTHFHMDHIQGFFGFRPLYRNVTKIHCWADGGLIPDWKKRLDSLMEEPLWPVQLDKTPAQLGFHDLNGTEQPIKIGDARISWCPLNHPQVSLAYRIEMPGYTIAIATDHEPGDAETDERLVEFCRDTNLLICDAQYTPEDYPEHVGWGHGTWMHAAEMAHRTNASRLILTHHDPERTDDEIDRITDQALLAFPKTEAARQNMVVLFDPKPLQAGVV